MRTARAGRWVGLLSLAVLLACPGGIDADDVPESAKKKFEEARALYVKGDEKSLQAAFSALSEAKVRAPDSADFWELFVRVWRASKKSEADLWDKIIAPREQAVPKSATFDIVRARVETDPAKKGEHLQKAIDKDPASVATRLMLVAHFRSLGEEMKAEELLDKVLADKPDHEEALVAKTEMLVESGLSSSAVAFAREALAKKECPALRYALALALRKQSQEDPAKKADALAEARKAVEGKPDPAYVATLADLLDESDRTSEAVSLLKTHFDKTGDARLGKRLGALAFRAGDYDASVKSLTVSAPTEVKAAKALALVHARRGRPKEAKAAIEQVLVHDKEAVDFAVQVELLLWDTAAARKRLQGRTGEPAKAALLRAHVLDGRAAEAATAAAPGAAAGTTREEEDLLLAVLEARLFARLGTKAPVVRKQLLDARSQAAQAVLPEAKAGPVQMDLTAKSGGYMERAVTYLRSACGTTFKFVGGDMLMTIDNEGFHVGYAVNAEAPCGRDPVRKVRFNQKVAKQGENIQIDGPGNPEGWKAAQDAFSAGCAALVAEDAAKAADHFGKAVEQEPDWHRAKLFRSLARAFMAGSDLATAAREGLDAVSSAPGDWEGREAAILLGAWAGVDIVEAVKSLQRHIEERCIRRFDEL